MLVTPSLYDRAFLAAADSVLDAVSQDAVEKKWNEPSALEGLTVGALACHLTRQVVRAVQQLSPDSASTQQPITAIEHYRRAAWVTAESLDDPSMDRSLDLAEAERGFVKCMSEGLTAHHELVGLIDGGSVADVVDVPWQGWALQRDAFLLTRMVEIVVHLEDLAASLGVDTEAPESADSGQRVEPVPAEVFYPVRGILVQLAEERHGRRALVNTLARKERAQPIAAF